MENYEFITFDNEDIIEALEDLYYKKTNKKVNIKFDDFNKINIRNISIRKSLTSNESIISSKPEILEMDYEGRSKISGELSEAISYGKPYSK